MPFEKQENAANINAFYIRVLDVLERSRVPFLLGGAYALACHTSIERYTKDMDVFVRPADAPRVLEVLAAAGYRTEIPFQHWLGKAFVDGAFIDVIFSSGNGLCRVNDVWFAHAMDAVVLGRAVRICAPEEMIWSKAFVMERERFDGADVAHLLRACGQTLDWDRLLRHFGPFWRVLLSHLVLFDFIYPGESWPVPGIVTSELLRRWQMESQARPAAARLCQGTLLSREQYLDDIERWGYEDARLAPRGTMSPEEVRVWTEAIDSSE
jgi:hypothetical protein